MQSNKYFFFNLHGIHMVFFDVRGFSPLIQKEILGRTIIYLLNSLAQRFYTKI